MVGRTKSVAEVSPLALSDLDQMFPETTPPAGSQRGGGGGGDGDVEASQRARSEVKDRIVRNIGNDLWSNLLRNNFRPIGLLHKKLKS